MRSTTACTSCRSRFTAMREPVYYRPWMRTQLQTALHGATLAGFATITWILLLHYITRTTPRWDK